MVEENLVNDQEAAQEENLPEESVLEQPEELAEAQEEVEAAAESPDEAESVATSEPVAESGADERGSRRHGGRMGGSWLGGFVLIALGAIFLLQNTTSWRLNNWWALFILIPAISSLANAWREYKAKGMIDSGISGTLVGGVMMLLVAIVFLFNLDWGAIWPVFLIVIGVGALLGGTGRK